MVKGNPPSGLQTSPADRDVAERRKARHVCRRRNSRGLAPRVVAACAKQPGTRGRLSALRCLPRSRGGIGLSALRGVRRRGGLSSASRVAALCRVSSPYRPMGPLAARADLRDGHRLRFRLGQRSKAVFSSGHAARRTGKFLTLEVAYPPCWPRSCHNAGTPCTMAHAGRGLSPRS